MIERKPDRTSVARRNLVVIRAGDHPYCCAWGDITRIQRDWDCYINYYGTGLIPAIGQEFTFRSGNTKFSGIADLLDGSPELLRKYDAFLFLDDDIEIAPAQIDEFFGLFHENRLMLAQPSLHPSSFFNHKVTVHDGRYLLRYTWFVEIMMPAFSGAGLARCLPTFRMSVSGWGLDYLWPSFLSWPHRGIAIVDQIIARHLKPCDPQDGPYYRMLKQMGVDADQELDEILQSHRINEPYHHQVYGGHRRSFWRRSLGTLGRAMRPVGR